MSEDLKEGQTPEAEVTETKAQKTAKAKAEAEKAKAEEEAKAEAEKVKAEEEAKAKAEAEKANTLTPLQLRVTNHGKKTHCFVSRINLEMGEATVLEYKNEADKVRAMLNFAQLNALSGFTRFEIDEE